MKFWKMAKHLMARRLRSCSTRTCIRVHCLGKQWLNGHVLPDSVSSHPTPQSLLAVQFQQLNKGVFGKVSLRSPYADQAVALSLYSLVLFLKISKDFLNRSYTPSCGNLAGIVKASWVEEARVPPGTRECHEIDLDPHPLYVSSKLS